MWRLGSHSLPRLYDLIIPRPPYRAHRYPVKKGYEFANLRGRALHNNGLLKSNGSLSLHGLLFDTGSLIYTGGLTVSGSLLWVGILYLNSSLRNSGLLSPYGSLMLHGLLCYIGSLQVSGFLALVSSLLDIGLLLVFSSLDHAGILTDLRLPSELLWRAHVMVSIGTHDIRFGHGQPLHFAPDLPQMRQPHFDHLAFGGVVNMALSPSRGILT